MWRTSHGHRQSWDNHDSQFLPRRNSQEIEIVDDDNEDVVIITNKKEAFCGPDFDI